MNQMLITPKELTFGAGSYVKTGTETIYTNVKKYDFSYLLPLGGFKGEIVFIPATGPYFLTVNKRPETLAAPVINHVEGFRMAVAAEYIEIASNTQEGVDMGVKTLVRMSGEFVALPALELADYPDIAFRAVHMCVFDPDDGTDKEETSPAHIKKMLLTAALCGYNHAFIEFWGMFPYEMEYAHWPKAYTKEEIDDIVGYALDKLHITPLPAQNLTSHAGWSRIMSRRHVVLDQCPELSDMWIPGGWCFATENKDTQRYLERAMDGLLGAFRNPPYLHAGCDKCFGFGSSEADRTTSADILFARHIGFLNNYLQKTKMIMWADMLYSSEDCLYWKCGADTALKLSKDIIMNIWTHNDPGEKWADAEFFEGNGFAALYSPFMQRNSIENMVRICKKRNSMGIVQTTWHKPQTAAVYVVMSGAMQWCGSMPTDNAALRFKEGWYRN